MQRFNTILIALCAILAVSLSTNNVLAQEEWTQQDFDDYFTDVENPQTTKTFDDDPEGYEFRGDINIPGNEYGDAVYSIVFEPGAIITFADENGDAGGSLTITTDGDTIGRIQVLGVAGNMVTMEAADVEWGGIDILTFPDGDNRIQYCDISNVEFNAVQIGLGNAGGQCVVASSHIHNNGGNGVQVWGGGDGSDFSIHSNVIHDNDGRGIQIDEDFNGANPELAVVNNVVYDNDVDGILLHNTDDQITIANNICYGNGQSQINLDNAAGNPIILNNTLNGQNIVDVRGINVAGMFLLEQ